MCLEFKLHKQDLANAFRSKKAEEICTTAVFKDRQATKKVLLFFRAWNAYIQ